MLRSWIDKDGNTGFIENKHDPLGTQNYTWWSTYIHQDGKAYMEDARYDTGPLAGGYYTVQYDPYNQHTTGQDAWSAWYRNYDVNGVLQQEFVKWDNMTSSFLTRDIYNNQYWGSSYSTYGTNGTQTSQQFYDDVGLRISETGGGSALGLTVLLFTLTW